MSFRLSFHLALLGPSGAHWLDDPPDLSCQDSTQEYAVDGSRLSCKQQVGGSSPPASSQNGRSQAYTACLAWPDVIPMSFCSNWNDIRRLGGRTGGLGGRTGLEGRLGIFTAQRPITPIDHRGVRLDSTAVSGCLGQAGG